MAAAIRAHLLAAAFGSALLLPAGAAAQHLPTCHDRQVRTVAGLQQRIGSLEARTPLDGAGLCELADLRLLTGDAEGAARLIETILVDQPRSVDAILALARVHAHEERDSQVVALLQRALAIDPAHIHARVQRADHVAGRQDPEDALPLFEAILAEHPDHVSAIVGTARVQYRLYRDSAAHALLDRALALDPNHAPAHLLKAELHVRALDEDARAAAAHRAVALDSLHADAQLAVAHMLRQRGDVDGAYARMMAVLAFDPTHLETHGVLGNGGSLTSWGRYPGFADDEVPVALARSLDSADTLLIERRFDDAMAAYSDIATAHPGLPAARLGMAAVHYYRGDYDTAYDEFLELAHDHPGLGLAHYGVSQAARQVRLLRDPRTAAALARFHALPRPDEPERLRAVFTDFDRLDDDLQKIVLLSVAPLSNYLPILALSGGSYHLLPFHHRLWNWEHTAGSRGRRTFDGRLWDDVKGQGGRNAVAGAEWTREVMLERFNVLAHEFKHQIHTLLTPAQRDSIDAMYEAARRERRTLDSYADSNPAEYIAQAYEAFISPIKDPRLGGTAGNAHDRLRDLDPRAHAFLQEVNRQSSWVPHAVQALHRRLDARGVRLDVAEREAEWAVDRYGQAPALISFRAGLARLAGDYPLAADRYRREIELAPDSLRGHAGLAETLALGSHDHAAAADVLDAYVGRIATRGVEQVVTRVAWLRLARHRVHAGQREQAVHALDRAAGDDEVLMLSAELATLDHDFAAATAAWLEVANSTASAQHVRARIELAGVALRADAPEIATRWLASIPDADRVEGDPLRRETEALLLHAQGNSAAALDSLDTLRAELPNRLETVTALIAIARSAAPERVPELIAGGRDIIQRAEPVETIHDDGAFGARPALLTARNRADFAHRSRQSGPTD